MTAAVTHDKTSHSQQSCLKRSPECEAWNNRLKTNQDNYVHVSFHHNTAELEGENVGKGCGLRHKEGLGPFCKKKPKTNKQNKKTTQNQKPSTNNPSLWFPAWWSETDCSVIISQHKGWNQLRKEAIFPMPFIRATLVITMENITANNHIDIMNKPLIFSILLTHFSRCPVSRPFFSRVSVNPKHDHWPGIVRYQS